MEKTTKRFAISKHINKTVRFAGKIGKSGMNRLNPECKKVFTLIEPVYAHKINRFEYAGYIWVELPKELRAEKGKVIEFWGKVEKDERGYHIRMTRCLKIENLKEDEVYEGVSMKIKTYEDKKRERYVNANLSIIRAYESGMALPENRDNERTRQIMKFLKHISYENRRLKYAE